MTQQQETEDGWLVRIRAQVMCRDEGTGGWVAVDGGGVANVMVGRRHSKKARRLSQSMEESITRPSNGSGLHYEYYIYGKRISDETEVLSCTIEKDFQYNKVMPTFHHWVTSERRFGLTFQTAADARAFDRGVRTAVEEILNGVGGPGYARKVEKDLTEIQDIDEDEIFEYLDLPSESRSSSESSVKPDVQTPILSTITLPELTGTPITRFPVNKKGEGRSNDGENPSYIEMTVVPVHDYAYPTLGPNCDSTSLRTVDFTSSPDPWPKKDRSSPSNDRLRCRKCGRVFYGRIDETHPCRKCAPFDFKQCIEAVTCYSCAQGLSYHLANRDDGAPRQPCACVPGEEDCVLRWIGLTLLSICCPCLCCYPPLLGLRKLVDCILDVD